MPNFTAQLNGTLPPTTGPVHGFKQTAFGNQLYCVSTEWALSFVDYAGPGLASAFARKTSQMVNPKATCETAISIRGHVFAMFGDHRYAYVALGDDGLKACVAYFKANARFHHPANGKLPEDLR